MIETDISLKPTPDLPVSNSSSFDIVAILNNKDTVRVGWESLTANYIKQTSDVPQIPGESSGRPYITFAADDTGLYVSNGSAWRKMATYGDNWDDLKSSDTRFLPVNSTITLNEEERANVFSSLQLGTATLDVAGLVKVSTDPEGTINIDTDGVLHVNVASPILETNPDGKPGVVYIKDFYDGFDENDSSDISSKCAVTERYVHQAIQNSNVDVPRATYTSAGIVQIDSNSALTVDDAGILNTVSATADKSGVVKLVTKENESAPAAISVGVANNLVEAKAAEILSRKATSSQLGLVKVPGSSAVTVNSSGELDVRYATGTDHGIVVVLNELSSDVDYSTYTSTAVTPGAVTEYVNSKLETLNQTFPTASVDTLGVVQIGSGVKTSESGVLSIDNATPTRLGGVTVEIASNDTAPSKVPTVSRVAEMVDGKIINFKDATATKAGVVRLGRDRDEPITFGEVPVGVNASGQLCIDSSEIAPATNTTTGVVLLSSSNTSLSSSDGLTIGQGSTGAIYVDASANRATTSKYGLVKLSTNSTLPTTNPGVGIDANGNLRLDGTIEGGEGSGGSGEGGGSSYVVGGSTDLNSSTSATVGLLSGSSTLAVGSASYTTPGVVKLGTSGTMSGDGISVGVDSDGRLRVNLGNASYSVGGIVKLGTSSTISVAGLPVGVDSDGRLRVGVYPASYNLGGIVLLGTSDVISSGTPVGVDSNGRLAVASTGGSTGGSTVDEYQLLHYSDGLDSLAAGPDAVAYCADSLAIGLGAVVGATYASQSKDAAATRQSSTSDSTTNNTSVLYSSNSVAVGLHAQASGFKSTSYGNFATASASSSTAIGNSAIASGSSSTATGIVATASGTSSTASGVNSKASGNSATASGSSSNASADYSTASGVQSTASGTNSTANGYNSTASGTSSTAIGNGATASQDYATASGYNAKASGAGSTAIGSSSTANTSSTAIGIGSTARGSDDTAIGSSSTASGNTSTAIGSSATASKGLSAAIGYNSAAGGANSVAIGAGARVGSSGTSSVAIGAGAYVNDAGVVAINAGGAAANYPGVTSTQFYIIPYGSSLATKYLDGEAGIGYIVLDVNTGNILARGCRKLNAICTQHTTDFTPTDYSNIQYY